MSPVAPEQTGSPPPDPAQPGPTSSGPGDNAPEIPQSTQSSQSAPSDGAPGSSRRGGLGAVLQEEEFSVAQAVGGRRGIAESVLPTLLFVVLFVVTRSVAVAAGGAVAVVVVLLVARIVQRQSPATVLGGLLGVALGAVLAIRSGEGSDFYWPGIVINAVTLALLLTTLALRRPLVGILVGLLDPRVQDWAQDPEARRVYSRATLLFVVLYAAKLGVQLPLLLTGQVAALGAAKIAMGLPAFAVIAYLVWLMHRGLLARREQT